MNMSMNKALHNMTKPTVSVIIPLFNKEKYIERALLSVLSQTHQPLDIIVVDDGSTDDGPERVLKLNQPGITLIMQENKGPGAARNAGLARAKGKYVAFLDADDEWFPSFIEKGLSLLKDKETNVTVVWTGYVISPGMRRNNVGMEKLGGIYDIGAETDVGLISNIFNFTSTCFAIIKTEVAKKWGGFFDRDKCIHGEDAYFFYKLLFNERIGIIDEPLGIYHRDASDLTTCGHDTLPPPGPHLMDPVEIIASCPAEKRMILRELLAIHAISSAKFRAKCGQGELAKEILARFLPANYSYPKNVIMVRFLIRISPVLPKVRFFWSSLKSKKRLTNRFV